MTCQSAEIRRRSCAFWTLYRLMSFARATGRRAKRLWSSPNFVIRIKGLAMHRGAFCSHLFFTDYIARNVMTIDALLEALPAYAKDLKLNFSSVVRQQTELSPTQLWGTVAACALASRSEALIAALIPEATSQTSAQTVEAAKAANAIMAMNNIYYRFLHLTSNEKYRSLRAGLRMNVLRSHGADPVDFELWCLAVSAINGCGACVDSHEKVLREKGAGEEKILAAVRLAAVLHALSVVVENEKIGTATAA